jgi:hypothetical protein
MYYVQSILGSGHAVQYATVHTATQTVTDYEMNSMNLIGKRQRGGLHHYNNTDYDTTHGLRWIGKRQRGRLHH